MGAERIEVRARSLRAAGLIACAGAAVFPSSPGADTYEVEYARAASGARLTADPGQVSRGPALTGAGVVWVRVGRRQTERLQLVSSRRGKDRRVRTLHTVTNPNWPKRQTRIVMLEASRSHVALLIQTIRRKTPKEQVRFADSESAFALADERLLAGRPGNRLKVVARAHFRDDLTECATDTVLEDVDVSGSVVAYTSSTGNWCTPSRPRVERVVLRDVRSGGRARVVQEVRHRYAGEGQVRIAGRRVAWAPGFEFESEVWSYDSRGRKVAEVKGHDAFSDFDVQPDGKIALCEHDHGLSWFDSASRRRHSVGRTGGCATVRFRADRLIWGREGDGADDPGALKVTTLSGRTRRLVPAATSFDWNGTGLAWLWDGVRYLARPALFSRR